MRNTIHNMEEILKHSVCGFHQYVLGSSVQLRYVSENLCDLLGLSEQELLKEGEDLYAARVHPADQARYSAAIRELAETEQSRTIEYRLMKKDGTILCVKDSLSPLKQKNGTTLVNSVLTDITELKNENQSLRFLNETLSCGFLKYTCEKQPRVTYVNQKMMDILRIPASDDGELDYLDMYKSNIFLMIPMEERHRFSLYLNRVYSADTPIAGEMAVLRCDGTRAYLFGWVTKCINEQGEEEFQSVCIDVTERHHAKRASETERYLKALTDVYDKIFEYDLGTNTVKCLYSNGSPMFQWLENVPMQIEDATEKWIAGTVAESDRDKVRAFFHTVCQQKSLCYDGKPPQITYQAKSSDGEMRLYRGIFLKMAETVNLYCCRRVPDTEETDILRSENVHLKENMQELVMHFTDGIAAFELTADGSVIPLYASDNVCEFFGYTKETWLPLMETRTPLEQFVAHSTVGYEKFAALLQNGESEFTYLDLKTGMERRIKAICSQKSPVGSAQRYVMLYKVEDPIPAEQDGAAGESTVSIRTFGYFDVFVDGKPIAFRNKKSKELFALLVDRRGGYITSEEAICFLWEDEPANSVTFARYRKVALRLKNTLEEYGVSDIIETVDGKRRIIPERVKCDLYDYLSGRDEHASLFNGSYLTNYSWGERTLGELVNRLGQEDLS